MFDGQVSFEASSQQAKSDTLCQQFQATTPTGYRLRLVAFGDAPKLFALIDQNRDYLRQWLPWLDTANSIEDSQEFISGSIAQAESDSGFVSGIWSEGEVLMGVVGLHNLSWKSRSAALGYWLGSSFQGQGVMTQACQTVMAYGFQKMDLNRIELQWATGNERSGAIARRLGMTHEGTLRQAGWLYNRFVDHHVYAMLRRDWEL